MAELDHRNGENWFSSMLDTISSVSFLVADILLLWFRVILGLIEALFLKFQPNKEKSVAGEIVLISGTGHGIGRELANQFAAQGATVICLDINEVSNKETTKLIKEKGYHSVFSYMCDVSNRDDIKNVAEKIRKEVGEVSILVNNAGIMPCKPLSSQSTADIKKTFDINVFAHFWMISEFLPSMVHKNHGHVVAISSMAGVLGLTNLVPYCGSKFAVRGLMEAIAEETRENNPQCVVHFTTIYPYIVDTGLCKNPKIRFPGLMSIVSPAEAASKIVQAVKQNQIEISIPSGLLTINNVLRLFPIKVCRVIKDFLDSGVEPHD